MAALQEPKRPASEYVLYGLAVHEAIQQELGTKEFGRVATLQTERWKAMLEGEKAADENQAAEAKAKYEKDVAAFKEVSGEVGKARKDQTRKLLRLTKLPRTRPLPTDLRDQPEVHMEFS
mmetsp:Transcript_68567/g.135573  ORF Transcript_68567/g.135573 Transcript_68567/m.135573 type:complete len:120 (-) Transcript_68567:619-978(-)